jgi:hypothetical protein
MHPGLVGIGDTPKLQFVGALLGTPHPPGYPLYTVLLHVFSYIPVGSYAFRANLVSGVFGAVSVGLAFLVLRALGTRALVAAPVALAFGTGRIYWSQAILAEVYTLNTAIVFGIVLALLRWRAGRRSPWLLGAIALFGLGVGHHLTMVMLGPVFVAFVLFTDRRQGLARPTLAVAAVMAVAGLSQYGLIWLRTVQGARFLESQASTLGELATIVTASIFQRHLFVLGWDTVLFERAPWFGELFLEELGPAALAAAALGVALAAWRRSIEGLFVAAMLATGLVFAINYDVHDVEVFLILPFAFAWFLAGAGIEAVARWEDRAPRPLAPSVALVLAMLVPAWTLASNFDYHDRREHVFEDRFFDRMFELLPRDSVVLSESYPLDHMVHYKLLAEHRGERRNVQMLPCRADVVERYRLQGYSIYAFQGCRARLQVLGYRFEASGLGLPTPRRWRELRHPDQRPLYLPPSRLTSRSF